MPGFGATSAPPPKVYVVGTDAGTFVEVQGTAEGKPFDRAGMETLMDLASAGLEQLFAAQAKTVPAAVSPADATLPYSYAVDVSGSQTGPPSAQRRHSIAPAFAGESFADMTGSPAASSNPNADRIGWSIRKARERPGPRPDR